MKNLLAILVLFTLHACSTSAPNDKEPIKESILKKKYPTTGSVERLHPDINRLIPKDAVIEVLAEGFTWTEGPLWIADGNYLLFSDIPPNKVMKWSEKEGATLYLTPSGYTGETPRGGEPGANALILDEKGQLVLCQHGDRRMARMLAPLDNPKPNFETIVGTFEGKRFNSPNDAVYDKAGNLYFTDPPYGLLMESEKELTFQGVFRYAADGQVRVVTDKLSRPNGLAFSPDEQKFYVSNSDPAKAIWMVYDMNADGSIAKESVFYDATGTKEKGLPDGMKIDAKGNIWATGPGGVYVFKADGMLLGKIKTGEVTSNCAFNEDGSVLYMTCNDYLMRIKVSNFK